MTYSSGLPSFRESKAIQRPSGDHVGLPAIVPAAHHRITSITAAVSATGGTLPRFIATARSTISESSVAEHDIHGSAFHDLVLEVTALPRAGQPRPEFGKPAGDGGGGALRAPVPEGLT